MSKKATMITIVLFIVGIFVALEFLQNYNQEQNSDLLVSSYSEISQMGEKNASIHIVEFGDYKCPYCQVFNFEVMPFIKEQYIDTGKAQFHFINYSFLGTDSIYMAEFAETVRQELGDEIFWQIHDFIYAVQEEETKVWGTEEKMVSLLEQLVSESEVEQVLTAVKNGKYKENIEEQNKLAKRIQVSGTPSIYINGEKAEFKTPQQLFDLIEGAIHE